MSSSSSSSISHHCDLRTSPVDGTASPGPLRKKGSDTQGRLSTSGIYREGGRDGGQRGRAKGRGEDGGKGKGGGGGLQRGNAGGKRVGSLHLEAAAVALQAALPAVAGLG